MLQVGKVGKLIKAVRDKPDHLDGFSTYTITSLLGADDEKVRSLVLRNFKMNKAKIA